MKRILKSAVFALTPALLLFGCLELGMRIAGIEPVGTGDDPYVGFESSLPLFERGEEGRDATFFELAAGRERFFNPARFAAQKGDGVRRIFCVGGSTTYGRPYRDATSFCGWLRATLAEVSPGGFEVINAGGISYASYRVAEVVRQIAELEPDAVIVYTGHNEFLEDRTYSKLRDRSPLLRRADLMLSGTRVYGVLQTLAGRVREELPAEVKPRLDNSIGPADYTRDDSWAEAVAAHFELNLQRIIEQTRAAGAVPIGVVPADNLRSSSPFKSEPDSDLGDTERERFAGLLADGVEALREGPLDAALRDLDKAASIAPRHAGARYWRGRALIEAGELSAGASELVHARDEDVCPLRATTPIVDISRSVYSERHVAHVDFPELLATKSSGASAHARGEEWFLDHVHPNLAGHRLLGRALLEQIEALGWLPSDVAQNEAAIARAEASIRARTDPEENGRAMRNLAKVLSWAGKTEDASRAAREALQLLGTDAESLFILSLDASDRGDHQGAISLLREALRTDPDWVKARHNLGTELARAGRNTEALGEYDAVIDLDPKHLSVHYNRGNALTRLGRLSEAARSYERALEIDASDAASARYLSELRAELAGT